MNKIWQVIVKRKDGSLLFDILVSSKEEAFTVIQKLFNHQIEGQELNCKYYRDSMATDSGIIHDVEVRERPVFEAMTNENIKFIVSMMK